MVEINAGSNTFFQFSILREIGWLRHAVTSRKGGVSRGYYSTFNLGYDVGDRHSDVVKNISCLADYFGISEDQLFMPNQSHSVNVRIISHDVLKDHLYNTDALISSVPGICLAVLTADCVPVLLLDKINKVIAAIHAGWKGTVGNIAGRTIREMITNFNSDPQHILACIGPCISIDKYEVGTEVSSNFRDLFGQHTDIIKKNPITGKDHINLAEANKQLLLRSGLKELNIETAHLCTYQNDRFFYSARRDGVKTGRFASCMMLL